MTTSDIILARMARAHLLAPAGDERSVLRESCGLQAQFYGNCLHALRIHCGRLPDESILASHAVKTWTLRGTLHLVARDDLPLFLHEGRRHFLRPCDTLADDEQLSAARKRALAGCITARCAEGVCTREELRALCRESGMTAREEESAFNAWGGLLRALCENGTLLHAAQQEKAFALCPPFTPMREEDALRALLRRYLTHYGPATVRDMCYFFALPQRTLLPVLEALAPDRFICEGKTFYCIGDINVSGSIDCCRFLAGFDPLLLGYEKKESLLLPQEALRAIFTLSGIVRPAILLNGRVVGFWKKNGKTLQLTGTEPLHSLQCIRIEEEADALWGSELSACVWAD